MNKIHSLVRSGIYFVKCEYDKQPLWKKSYITISGCFLRLSKRPIDHVNGHKLVHEQDFVCDRYQQFELADTCTVKKHLTKDMPYQVVQDLHTSASHPDCHGGIIECEGLLPNCRKTKLLIAFEKSADCDGFMSQILTARKYLIRFSQSANKYLLLDIAQRMKNEVSIRERTYFLSIYYRCFIGSEAAAWIAADQKCTLDQAVEIGNELVNLKIIHHVTYEHLFCNGYFFYRFDVGALEAHEETIDMEHTQSSLHANSSNPHSAVVGRLDDTKGPPPLNRDRSNGSRMGSSGGRAIAELREEVQVLSKELSGALFVVDTLRYDLSETTSDLQRLQRTSASMETRLAEVRGCLLEGETRIRRLQTTLAVGSVGIALAAQLGSGLALWQMMILCVAVVALADRWVAVCSSESSDTSTKLTLQTSSGNNMPVGAPMLGSLLPQSDDDDDMEPTGHPLSPSSASREGSGLPNGSMSVSECSQSLPAQSSRMEAESDVAASIAVADRILTFGPSPIVLTPSNATDTTQTHTSGTVSTKHYPVNPNFADIPRDRESWPNFPILARRGPDMLPTRSIQRSDGFIGEEETEKESNRQRQELLKPLHLHQPGPLQISEIPLESDLFEGKMILVLSGLPDSPTDFFRPKRRTFEAIVQGRFKRRVSFASVYTGQIFSQPFQALPPVWVCRTIMAVLSRLQPAVQMCLEGDRPYIVSPLASTSKHIVVSRPGQEPALGEVIGHVEEDMRLVDATAFRDLPSANRVAFLSKRSNLEKYHYEPDLVYTFDFYQHVLNMGTMKIDIGITSFDILKVIGQCPVQTMSVCWDPVEQPDPPSKVDFLYNVELWHERNFPSDFFQNDAH